MNNPETTLLPCHVCGGLPRRNGRSSGVGGVICKTKMDHVVQVYGATQDDADRIWNTREAASEPMMSDGDFILRILDHVTVDLDEDGNNFIGITEDFQHVLAEYKAQLSPKVNAPVDLMLLERAIDHCNEFGHAVDHEYYYVVEEAARAYLNQHKAAT